MTDADYNRKQVAAQPQPVVLNKHVTLRLRPVGTVRYAVTARWGESCRGRYTHNATHRQLAVTVAPLAEALAVTVAWVAPPVLDKTQPVPFDAVTLRLAELYRRVVVRASPSGQLLELLNQPEIAHTWAAVRQQLCAEREHDAVATGLCEALDDRVRDGAALLRTLPADYFFPLFFKNVYGQAFDHNHAYAQPVGFSHFFADVPLAFVETMTYPPTDDLTDTATLRFAGVVDESFTNRPAIAQAVAERLETGASVTGDDLRFAYTATHRVHKATGLPVAIDAAVACWAGTAYKKDYTLTVRPL